MDDSQPDPRNLTDRQLVDAYEATDGGNDDDRANELAAEIERRGLDV